MMSQYSFRNALVLLLASGALLVPRDASAANSCSQSSDCPKGFSCQVSNIEVPCEAIACDPGETCAQPICSPQTVSQCVPLPCTSDGDCASGMVCFTQTSQDCSEETTPACPPGGKCAPPDPTPSPTCTTTTTRSCVPKYMLPCKVASDCGDGFTCDPDEVGTCSGGGSVPSEDGGPVPLPEPTVCNTMTLSTSHCSAKTVSCSSASDCPSDWTCEAQATNAATVECAGPVSVDVGSTAPDCPSNPPPPPQKVCTPPYADLVSAGDFGDNDSTSTLNGGGTAAPESAGTPPAAGSTGSNDGGCSLGSGRAGNGATPLLGLVGFVALAFRRRRTA
jgi:MYXO-CTERM domain-containing protein